MSGGKSMFSKSSGNTAPPPTSVASRSDLPLSPEGGEGWGEGYSVLIYFPRIASTILSKSSWE